MGSDDISDYNPSVETAPPYESKYHAEIGSMQDSQKTRQFSHNFPILTKHHPQNSDSMFSSHNPFYKHHNQRQESTVTPLSQNGSTIIVHTREESNLLYCGADAGFLTSQHDKSRDDSMILSQRTKVLRKDLDSLDDEISHLQNSLKHAIDKKANLIDY
jgi:hypothetical protein